MLQDTTDAISTLGEFNFWGPRAVASRSAGPGRAPSVHALIRFNAWSGNYGTQKAGLPEAVLEPLCRSTALFQEKALRLRNDLLGVGEQWQQLIDARLAEGSAGPAATKLLVERLTIELYSLKRCTDTMLGDAATTKAQAAEAQELVRSHGEADLRQLQWLNNDIGQADRALRAAWASLEEAKSELEGEKGFLNGFLTAITFTLYDPLQENMDKANQAVAEAGNQLNRLAGLQNHRTRCLTEQAQAALLLDDLTVLDEALTDFQNLLHAALTILGNAYGNESKYLGAGGTGAADYYFRAGAKNMDDLFAWAEAFFAGSDGRPLAPVSICSLVRGDYQCRQQDSVGMAGWDRATAVRLNDQSLLWTNGAGVSWTLHLTPDTAALALGSDCPFYDTVQTVGIVWEGSEVAGLRMGRAGELFARV